MPEMGRRLVATRLRAGYRTQGAFAKALGVSRGLVGQWETDAKRPGRNNLAKIAKLCGISMEYLQGDTTDMTRSFVISAEQEAELILGFRRLPPRVRQNILNLVTEWGNRSQVPEKKSEPA